MTEFVKVGEKKYVSKTVIEKAAAGNEAALAVLGNKGVSVSKTEPRGGAYVSSGVAKKLQEAGYVSKDVPIQEGAYYKVEKEEISEPQITSSKTYPPVQITSDKITSGTSTTQSITSQEFYIKGKDIGVKVISSKPIGEVVSPESKFMLDVAPYAALGVISATVPPVGIAVVGYSAVSIGKEIGTGVGTSIREKSITPTVEAGKNVFKGFISPENIAFMIGFGGASLAKTDVLKPVPKREYLLEFNKEELVNIDKKGFGEVKGYLIAKEGKKDFVVGEVETALKYTKLNKKSVASEGVMNIKLYEEPIKTRTFGLLSKEISYNKATKTSLSDFIGETYEERLKIDFNINLAEGRSEPILRIEREPKSFVRGTALTKEVVRIEYPEGKIRSQAGFGSVSQAVGLDEQTKMFGKAVDLSKIKVYDLRKETEFKPTKYSPQKTTLDVGVKPSEASVLPAAKELTKIEIGKELSKIEPKQKTSVNLVPLDVGKSEVKQKQTSVQKINLGVSLRQDVRQKTLTIRKVKLEQQSTLGLEQKQSNLSKQERINIPSFDSKMLQKVGVRYRNELKEDEIIKSMSFPTPKLNVKPSRFTFPKLNFPETKLAGYSLYSAYRVKKSKSKKDIYVLADMLTWTMKGFGKKSPLWKAPSSKVKSKFLTNTLTTMRFPLQRGGRKR